MKTFKINKGSILKAVAILKRGGVVVYPTETAYAMGADFTNEKAVAKIFKIKNRPAHKNLPAICYSKKQVKEFFEMPASTRSNRGEPASTRSNRGEPDIAWKIWKKYWPKPVSVIMKCKFPSSSFSQKGVLGAPLPLKKGGLPRSERFAFYYWGWEGFEVPVRISSNKTARDLARGLGRPIVSTSANISGTGALYDAKKIAENFSDKKYRPDLILDGGSLSERPPSTIIKISSNVKSPTLNIEVIRQGEAKISSV